MKKFIACTFTIAVMVLLVFYFTGGSEQTDPGHITGVTEAAFSMPNSRGGTDVTSFLVGSFAGDDGSRLCFSDCGVTCWDADGTEKSGSCTLMQTADHSAVIQFSFGETSSIYSFKLVSEYGNFTLTDTDKNIVTYSPYMA